MSTRMSDQKVVLWFPIPYYKKYVKIVDYDEFLNQINLVSIGQGSSVSERLSLEHLFTMQMKGGKSFVLIPNQRNHYSKKNSMMPFFYIDYSNEKMEITAKSVLSSMISVFIIITLVILILFVREWFPIMFVALFYLVTQGCFWIPFEKAMSEISQIVYNVNTQKRNINILKEEEAYRQELEDTLEEYYKTAGISKHI